MEPPSRIRHPVTPLERRAYRRLAVMAAAFTLLLLSVAGGPLWPGGWAFLAIFFGGSFWITYDMARRDPALLAERMTPIAQEGQPDWDRRLLKILLAAFLLWIAAMALERRFSDRPWPAAVQALGGLGLAAGLLLIGITARANTFLAPVVRMQAERNQTVVSTGPYAVVRHPMYAGAVLMFVFTPMLLSAFTGFAGSALLIALLARRTTLEDHKLRQELDGYAAYAAKVRFRLVPGLW